MMSLENSFTNKRKELTVENRCVYCRLKYKKSDLEKLLHTSIIICDECNEMISFITSFKIVVDDFVTKNDILDSSKSNELRLMKSFGYITSNSLKLKPITRIIRYLLDKTIINEDITFRSIDLSKNLKGNQNILKYINILRLSNIIEVNENSGERIIIPSKILKKFTISRLSLDSNGKIYDVKKDDETELTLTVLGYFSILLLKIFADNPEDELVNSFFLRGPWIRFSYLVLYAIENPDRPFTENQLDNFLKVRNQNSQIREEFKLTLKRLYEGKRFYMIKSYELQKLPGKMTGEFFFTFDERFISDIKYVYERKREIEITRS